jgi:hypothetical protein
MGGRGGASSDTSAASVATGPVANASTVAVRAVETARNTSSYPYLGVGERTVADVRDALARQGITGRAEQDAALRAASRSGLIEIGSAVARYALTQREREGGIMMGGQVDELVSIRR